MNKFAIKIILSLFFVLGLFSFTKNVEASDNCQCSSGSLIPFKYDIVQSYNASNDFDCKNFCRVLPGVKYYSYSNLGNFGFSGVSKCYKDSDCNSNEFPICNKSTGGCLSEADATKTASVVLNPSIVKTSDVVPGSTESGGLVQCGRGGQKFCTLCDLIKGLNYIIRFIMKISIVVALAAFTIGGLMYIISVGDPKMIDRAKGAMKNATIGIVVIFTAWLIINTLLYSLGTYGNLGISGVNSWGDFQCEAGLGK